MAGREQHREHVVALARRRARARRSSISSKMQRVGLVARAARTARQRPRPRCAANGSIEDGVRAAARGSPVSRSRSASSRAPGSSPNTARRITSSVSAWRRGWSATGSSRGQRVDLALGHLRHRGPTRRCIFSPWKAGSISLRCSRWAPSSSRITEFAPTTGSRMRAPSPGCSTSGGAVKTSLTSLRVREVHERRRLEQAHREALAVARAAALEERHRAVPPGDRLKRCAASAALAGDACAECNRKFAAFCALQHT